MIFLAAAIATARAQPMELAVMSFNVQQPFGTAWEARRDKAGAILAAEAPDIAGTQEAVASQRDDLLARAPGYGYFGAGRDGGQNGEGCWILYRSARFRVDSSRSGNFWLSNTPNAPSRYGGAYNRLCTFARLVEKSSGRAVMVYNAHFYLESESAYRLSSAGQMAKAMAADAAAGEAVLATGDFNSPESDAVTRWFKQGQDNPLRLRDTYRDYDPTGTVVTGFGTKLDYVYVPAEDRYATVKAWVIKEPAGASDHMPIQSALRISFQPTSMPPRPGPKAGRAWSMRAIRLDGRETAP